MKKRQRKVSTKDLKEVQNFGTPQQWKQEFQQTCNLRQMLTIDPMDLENELYHQATDHQTIGEMLAEARADADIAEERTKLVRSQLIKWANENTSRALGVDVRPSDAKIEAYYRNHKDHISARYDEIRKRYIVNLLESALYSSIAKKDNLGHLCQMMQSGLSTLHKKARAKVKKQRR